MSDEQSDDQEVLSERLGLFGRIDEAIFNVEVVVIVLALIVMSVIVFTDIVYQLVLSFKQAIQREESGIWGYIIGLTAFVGAMLFATTAPPETDESDEPEERGEERSLAQRIGITTGLLVCVVVAALALLYLSSATIYRLTTIGLCIPVGLHYWEKDQRGRLGALVVLGGLAVWTMGGLPEAYSWAQSYGLFLLLWVGFLGASIAARERRHLRVDLLRNLLPPRWVPHFNAFSYLVAAAFTATFFYLGYLYVFGPSSGYLNPIWEAPAWLPGFLQDMVPVGPPPEEMPLYDRILNVVFGRSPPGEVPDWLKVLSIPTAMVLVVIRFLGHAVVFARMAMRGESFEESAEAH